MLGVGYSKCLVYLHNLSILRAITGAVGLCRPVAGFADRRSQQIAWPACRDLRLKVSSSKTIHCPLSKKYWIQKY